MIMNIERVEPNGGSTIEQLIDKFTATSNPVTQSSYKEIIVNRLTQASKTGKLQ